MISDPRTFQRRGFLAVFVDANGISFVQSFPGLIAPRGRRHDTVISYLYLSYENISSGGSADLGYSTAGAAHSIRHVLSAMCAVSSLNSFSEAVMKALSKTLYSVKSAKTRATPSVAYERVSAAELDLPESWFRNAIFDDPELVIGACREAGRVPDSEKWFPWASEVSFGAGPVDVLLLSSHGRPAIIETKLSYNPQKRREVVAQLLDYALSLQEVQWDELPTFTPAEAAPNREDLNDCLRSGKFLLVVAGDALDPRALRLSEAILARHLTTEWDLAMVDMNLYRSKMGDDQLLIVPELRGVVLAETRQVVKVQVEGTTPRARIIVERVPSDDISIDRKPKLASIDDFVARVRERSPKAEQAVRQIVERFSQIDGGNTESRFAFGLQTATAILYWKATSGTLKRIFQASESGRFRVWVGPLLGEGRDDLATTIRELSRPIVTIEAGDLSAALFVDDNNVSAILSVIDSVVASIVRFDA